VQATVAHFRLAPVSGEQMSGCFWRPFELAQEHFAPVVDADSLPVWLDEGPVPLTRLTRYCSLNCTVTVITTGIGSLFKRAGVNFHLRTASRAA
jgi:hypothetical protein